MEDEKSDATELHPQDNSSEADKITLQSDGKASEADPKPVEEVKEQPEVEAEEKQEEPEEVELPEEFKEYGELGKFAMELRESGDISKDSIAEIKEKYKLPEVLINEYIENAKALMEARTEKAAAESAAFVKSIHDSVGGEKRYAEITAWAKEHLAPDEVDTFNNMVSGNKAEAKLAVEGLKARFEAVNGVHQPELVQGRAVAKTEGGYSNMEEYIADLADPRAKFDKAYMAAVNKKLERSDLRKLK